ncbi:tRNA epoxyqueuosine(34) reductase QueG [Clostridium tyrobutyricum]|uniref:tRNA epoxyqueuosine(34) reductase QueG n=1 Tax=Clostridium tyrobutyricum TaxID=1519 RepID=UPI00073DA978|nr:tRNA epoxyqueuosine(34) reductase QueG [Clostridium tyrobutyricum]
MNYKNKLIEFCRKIGIDTIGFTECRIFCELYNSFKFRRLNSLSNEFEEKDENERINPFVYMKEGKTIISVAFPYLFNRNTKDNIGFSLYTRGQDYHKVVFKYLNKICLFIESMGGKAVPLVDSNMLPERYIAKLCGIGFLGKNNMLITKRYGSYVFLGEIITDLALGNSEILQSQCGDCSICLKACPTGAIRDKKNSNKCMSYITQKKHIEDEWILKFRGNLFGCDICQNVCPYNRKVLFSNIKEFKPFEFMEDVNLSEILSMDNKIFRQKYAITSCGWRGKNIIIRNALINSFISGRNITIKNIRSPYVQDYYNRLFKLFKL